MRIKGMKKLGLYIRYTLLFVLAFSIIYGEMSCSQCSRRRNQGREVRRGEVRRGVDPKKGRGGRTPEKRRVGIGDFDYSARTYHIPAGSSLQEVIYQNNPGLEQLERETGLGGSKLVGEMSADADGKNYSRPVMDDDVPIRRPPDLGLLLPEAPDDIVMMILRGYVSVSVGRIRTCGIFDPVFEVLITIYNKTDADQDVVVDQGQMIESGKEGVQNIVVKEKVSASVPGHGSTMVTVQCLCAARHRGDPSGSVGRLTPYRLNAPPSAYATQESVWDYIESIYSSLPTPKRESSSSGKRHKLVFYAWGSGQQLEGHKSDFGHAFVDIPTIGPVGYGGRVTDHRDQVRYAKYRCEVWISDAQLERVISKYWEWKNDPPQYDLMRTDCTTFALDIADAAGVEYGSRMIVQSPAFFLKQLLKYNPQQ